MDHLDIDFSERKIENNAKEYIPAADKLFLSEKLEGEPSHQLFDDLRIPSFNNFSDGGDLTNPNKENRRDSNWEFKIYQRRQQNKGIEIGVTHNQDKMQEEFERNLPSEEKIAIDVNNKIFYKDRKENLAERDTFLSLLPDRYHTLKGDAKSYNREDFYDFIDESDKLSALDAMIKKLVKSQSNLGADLSMMEKCYRTDGHVARHFEELPQTFASRETMSSM